MARSDRWLFAAFVVALAASLGALFVGEVMGQEPCKLCWFQRAFMFPLAIVLGIAAFRSDTGIWRYALPLSIPGLLVAAYHSLLYAGVIDEAWAPCTLNGPSCSGAEMLLFDAVPLPYLATTAFLFITFALIPGRKGRAVS